MAQQTVQILRTTTNTAPPTLLPGAFSVELGSDTRLWIGAAGGNRLLLSSNPADSPLGVGGYAKLASPVFTGDPQAPTPATADNDTSIATTAFVKAQGYAVAANYLPLTGGTLSGPGNLTARGGILAGAAGSVPGAGALTLNANTVAPPAGLTPNLYVVGADATATQIFFDGFGTPTVPTASSINFRRARGTAAAPTAVQANDILGYVGAQGATGPGTYGIGGAAAIYLIAAENFAAGSQGTFLQFNTIPAGTATSVVSLKLAGNTATFSGNINASNQTVMTSANGFDATVILNSNANASGHFWSISAKTTGEYWVYDNTASALRLAINSTGACSASSAWGVISDAALKDEIVDNPRGLADILKLQPRQFRMVDDNRMATGLIAQELEAVMPELVGEMLTPDGGTVKTVIETGVIWPLINAIKELKAEIDALKGTP